MQDFPKSIIDRVVSSSARKRGQMTEGARAIVKKIGHAEAGGYRSAFEHIEPTQENAEQIIQDIMMNPDWTFTGDKVIDVYDSAGHGVRFDRSRGYFMGFLEGALTRQ